MGKTLAVIEVGIGTALSNRMALPEENPLPLADSAATSGSLVIELNLKRAAAARGPLTAMAQQERIANRIARHFFTALDSDPQLADRIALGLMAGYEVGGLVERGAMQTVLLPSGADLHEVVRAIMVSPFGRASLLGNETNRIAVSSFTVTGGASAVFLTATRWPRSRRPMPMSWRCRRASIPPARQPEPPIIWDPDFTRLCAESSKKVAGQTADVSDALGALKALAQKRYLSGRMFAMSYERPDKFKVDPNLLDPNITKAGIATFYVRPTRDPWASRMAMFFFPVTVAGQMAEVEAPTPARAAQPVWATR